MFSAFAARPAFAQATPPSLSNFQGRLTDVAGVPQAGPFDFQFLYYDAPAAGTLLLTEQQLGVTVTSGIYNVTLGAGGLTPAAETTFAGVFANHGNVYLEVQVKAGGGPTYDVLSPRTQIAAAPFAVNADKLDGLDATAFAPASGSANYAPASGSANYAPATGSANYVAKAGDTMAGALNLPLNGLVAGTNQLVLAGGNVGIGLTTPARFLHIAGSSNATDAYFVRLESTATPARQWDLNVKSGNFVIGDNTVVLDRFVIDTAGNVGIGSTAPTQKLDVAGTIRSSSGGFMFPDGSTQATAAAAGANTALSNLTATAVNLDLLPNVDNALDLGSPANSWRTVNADTSVETPILRSGAVLNLIATGANSITATTNGLERLRIDAAGKVGINQTAPAAMLDITAATGGATRGLVIKEDAAQSVNLLEVQDSSAASMVRITSTGDLEIYNPGATLLKHRLSMFLGVASYLAADAGSNVGIGTTAPATKLDVAGTVTATAFSGSGAGLTGIAAAGGWTDGGANVTLTTSTDAVGIGAAAPAAKLDVDAAAGNVLRLAYAGVTKLIMNSAGAVGIGTTAPAGALQVAGGQLVVPAGSLAAPSIGFDNSLNTGIYSPAGGWVDIVTSGSSAIRFLSGSIVPMGFIRVNTDGSAAAGAAYTFNSDPTYSGMFRPANNTLAFSTNAAERLRIDPSGNVGIGTTAPSGNLTVHGGATNAILQLQNTSTGGTLTDGFELSYGTDAYVWNHEPTAILFATSSTERMRIDSAGSVGIGTTAPTQKLDVAGTVKAAAFQGDGSGLTNISAAGGWTDGGANVALTTIGDSVGIGIATPSAKLHVMDGDILVDRTAGAATVTLGSTSGATPQVVFGGTSGGILSTSSNTLSLRFASGASASSVDFEPAKVTFRTGGFTGFERLTIDSVGNVGIGTTAPVKPLDVAGNIGSSGTVSAVSFVGGGAGLTGLNAGNVSIGTLPVARGGTGTTALTAGGVLFAGVGGTAIAQNNANLYWDNATLRLGIGTNAPSSQLANTSSTLQDQASSGVVAGSGLTWIANGSGYAAGISQALGAGMANGLLVKVTNTTNANILTLNSGTAQGFDRFVVLGSGNVGIGTNSPSDLLHLYAGAPSLALQGTTGARTYKLLVTGAGQFEINDATAAANRITIEAAGNVGIGSSTPGQKLTVAGTVESTSGGFKFPDGTTQATAAAGGSGAAGQVTFWTGASAQSGDANFFWDNTNKRLGIGTSTTGTNKLHVVGTAANEKIFFESSLGSGNPGIIVKANPGAGQAHFSADRADTGADASLFLLTGGVLDWMIRTNPGVYNLSIMNNAATEVMTVLQNGNVGIGSTNPGQKLSVAGTVESTTGGFKFPDGTTQATAATGTNVFLQNGNAFGTVASIGTNDAFPLSLETNNTSRMWFDTSGNVGIGTTAPATELHVFNNVGNPSVRVSTDNAAASAFMEIGRTSNLWTVGTTGPVQDDFFVSNGVVRLYIAPAGNVGIGTTAPAQLLDVNGNVRVAGSLNVIGASPFVRTAGDTMTGALTISSSTTPALSATTSAAGGYGVSGTGGTGAGAAGVYGTVSNGDYGVFGLNTSTTGTIVYGVYGQANGAGGPPHYGVYGTASGAATVTDNVGVYGFTPNPGGKGVVGYSAGTTGIGIGVYGLTLSSSGIGVQAQNDGATGAALYVMNNNMVAAGDLSVFKIGTGAGGNAFFRCIDGASVDKFLVKGTGDVYAAGNVGIGTTAPAEKLDVSGNVRLTGKVTIPDANGTTDGNGVNDVAGGDVTATGSVGRITIAAGDASQTVFTVANVSVTANSHVFVTNTGTGPASIQRVTISAGQFTVTFTGGAPGSGQTFDFLVIN